MGLLTHDWTIDVLVLVLAGVVSLYLYFTRNFNYWKNQGVKEATPTFPFGNVAPCVFARKNPVKLISQLYHEGEGEKMIGFYSFDTPYLIIRDLELIKNVLIRDFNNFSNKIMVGNDSDPLGAKSLFLAHNPPWRHIRQKLTPIFTTGKLKNMFPLMLEICQDFYDYLDNLQIDCKCLFNRL